ncbi:MAG: fasciclin domain-containing protein [Rhodanobacteraceae bacterium]
MKKWPSLLFASSLVVCGVASAKNIVQTAKDAGQFTILLKAAAATGMDKTLAEPGPYTVFAPTDAAFNALPPGMLDKLMQPQNRDMLKKVLGYHTLFGRLTTRDLKNPKSAAATTIGAPVILEMKNGGVMVNGARITQPDIPADNGVIHVIDKVLLPATPIQPKT